jgi:putative heme-binding domain-containing protein
MPLPRLVVCGLASVAAGLAWAARPDAPPAGRKPWTASRVVGRPEPPPKYRAAVAFPNLKFDHPLLVTHVPGTDRLTVGEQGGKLFTFPNRPDARAEPFADLPRELKRIHDHPGAKGFDSLYGLAFHPRFPAVRECFVCYTLSGKKGQTGPFQHEKNLPDGSRVSRFRVTDADPPRLDPASEEIVLTYLQGGHNGGDLQFGPDGCLYISTGDSTDPNPPDLFRTGQDVTDLQSSVLRIDVTRKDPGKNYAVPADNPFVGLTVGGKPARPEVWAYGFRNPWRMSFDRKTGELWVGDVGWERWEMIHRAEKGGNYGWSVTEAREAVNADWPTGPTPVQPPAVELDHTLACSITGGYVYRGKKRPELVGKYVFGDWETRRFWAAQFDGDRLQSLDELLDPTVRVVAFGEDRDGELYFLDYDTGRVHTLVPNDAAAHDPAAFPRTLSATGLFASTRDHAPADGVYRFAVNARQWQDGATAEHLVALPGTSAVTDFEEKKPLPGNVNWHYFRYHFPKDAVLARTMSLGGKRVETQLLHFDGETWRGYSYAWREDGTDADLVPADGSERMLSVPGPTGPHRLTWAFNARAQCLQCHNAWAEYTLAFNPEQLNRDVPTPDGPANQLAHLGRLGLLNRVGRGDKPKGPYTAEEAARERRLADPHGSAAGTERTRSYLHANCGHCHRFGGGGAVDFELHAFADLGDKKLIDARPTRGTFDLPDPRIVAPGSPERSVVYYRMAKFGGGRMPHLGSELPDEHGLALVRDWIAGLKPGGPAPSVESKDRLASPAAALPVARAVAANALSEPARGEVLRAAAALPPGNVRDLFEGYLPDDGKPRKLGTNPRPRAILGLTGDPAAGKTLFFAQRSQCATCHKMDGQGTEVGPDLSAVGKTRTREFILESVLDPSRRVEQPYQAYLLRTQSGATHTGLLVKKDGVVVLKDAQNKLVTVPADDVESLTPSRQSLMPEGLLRDFTPQEAADLLAYLASRKGTP